MQVDLTKAEGYIDYVAKNTKKAWLIRHGATSLNHPDPTTDRIRGWIDVPLSEDGKKDAKTAGAHVKRLKIKKVFTSDLKRAKETAEIIGQVTPITIIRECEFRPWKFGPTIEGKVTAEVIAKITHLVLHPDEVPPEGESFNGYKERTIKTYLKTRELAKDETYGIVCHYRTILLLHSWQLAGKNGFNIDVNHFLSHASNVQPGYVMTID